MGLARSFLFLLFSLIIFGSVYAAPGIPHQFYGTVTVNGAPADGASIVAKINGVEYGRITSSNGTYGFYPNLFFVTDPNNTNAGRTIELFLNANKVAEQTFVNGGYTQLDLFYGSAPYCGDGTCNAGEDCSNCAADCGSCPVAPSGGGGGAGGGGVGGGGAAGGSFFIQIIGGCSGQPISVGVVNFHGNPVEGVEITVRHNRQEVGNAVTEADGNVSFTFSEVGKYDFRGTKGGQSSVITTIELVECREEAVGEEEEEETETEVAGGEDLCEGIDCNDKNPCTDDRCRRGTCVYTQLDDATCGENAVCRAGECVSTIAEMKGEIVGATPMGLFGLASLQGNALIVAIILAVIGILLTILKLRKKKK